MTICRIKWLRLYFHVTVFSSRVLFFFSYLLLPGMASDNTTRPPTAGTSRCLPTATPGECFWQSQRDELHDHRSTEQLPEHTDVLIIGAGYSGVSTAWHIIKDYPDAKKSIAILEARGACSGATGRNGGHARPDFCGHITTYMDRAGVRAGAEIAEFEISTLRALKKFITEENIDCDFTLTRSIDVWCNEDAAAKAKAVYDMMVAQGLDYMDDAVFYTGEKVEGVSPYSHFSYPRYSYFP